MSEKKKRILSFAIDKNVSKLTILGQDSENNVVLREELSEDELDMVSGGGGIGEPCPAKCPKFGPFCKLH